MTLPNRRERSLASECMDQLEQHASNDGPALIANAFAAYREELLRPFVELRRDAIAYRDMRGARVLEDIIVTARGET